MDVLVINSIYQIISITSLWIVCLMTHNGSWIDIGWPSGFVFSAIITVIKSPSNASLNVISAGYIICGARFIIGWFLRMHYKHQDHRFNLWCKLWSQGEGSLFYVIHTTSIPIHYLIWFELQALCNMTLFYAPLYVVSLTQTTSGSSLEWLGVLLWFAGIAIEHTSDIQLVNWKKAHRGSNAVCMDGLWWYSRHPNYFGEILVWTSYSIFAMNSVLTWNVYSTQFVIAVSLLISSPYSMYRWLRYTAAWILEMSSVQKRPKYVEYQGVTNMIIPWFKSSKSM
eukprot:63082_1